LSGAEIKQTVRKLGVSRYIASQSDDFGDFSDSEGLKAAKFMQAPRASEFSHGLQDFCTAYAFGRFVGMQSSRLTSSSRGGSNSGRR